MMKTHSVATLLSGALSASRKQVSILRPNAASAAAKTKLPVTIPTSTACNEALQTCFARAGRHEDVFVDEMGCAISDQRVRRTFDRAKRLAGITRRFRFHDLRHTFGSRLASSNVAVQVISKVMGHTSIAMTMRYARPSSEALRDVMRALDDE